MLYLVLGSYPLNSCPHCCYFRPGLLVPVVAHVAEREELAIFVPSELRPEFRAVGWMCVTRGCGSTSQPWCLFRPCHRQRGSDPLGMLPHGALGLQPVSPAPRRPLALCEIEIMMPDFQRDILRTLQANAIIGWHIAGVTWANVGVEPIQLGPGTRIRPCSEFLGEDTQGPCTRS